MELSSPDLIAKLLAFDSPMPTPRVRRAVGTDRGGRRCKCGSCKQCLDEARWERIYREKFEDPSYYSAKPTRFSSTLEWTAGYRD